MLECFDDDAAGAASAPCRRGRSRRWPRVHRAASCSGSRGRRSGRHRALIADGKLSVVARVACMHELLTTLDAMVGTDTHRDNSLHGA